ncbi:hypothetical protein KI387_007952 [Taxus chinensis]|uniref:Uncharacterized protein n=1 Tax=Taxus chinensis TaxID=29808 RepID=A0AA38GQT2_TAXCH|nr:hypothetical protein KI387_007952 [Taxus chinensis]
MANDKKLVSKCVERARDSIWCLSFLGRQSQFIASPPKASRGLLHPTRETQEKDNDGKEEVGSGEKDEGKDAENVALKKPVKLVPCPRYENMDSKFCYCNVK